MTLTFSPFYPRYRFAEIYYRRGESNHKGRSTPARVETTVIFLPDVWNICPTKLEWDGLHLNYKRQLEKKSTSSTGGSQQQQTQSMAQLDEQEEEEEDDKALLLNLFLLCLLIFLQTSKPSSSRHCGTPFRVASRDRPRQFSVLPIVYWMIRCLVIITAIL